MNTIDPSQLLSQLRATAAAAQGGVGEVNPQNSAVDFKELLQQSINNVSEMQSTAGQLAESFEKGDSQVSLEQVMIAKQKANISFQAMLQVRNKLLNAYHEIMSMPV